MLHSPLPTRWLSRIRISDRQRYPAECLIIEGTRCDAGGDQPAAFVVLDGVVRLSLFVEAGQELVLAYLPTGSLFGEQAALSRRGLDAQLVAIADDDCVVGKVTANDLTDFVLEHPDALIDLMGITGKKTSLFLQALARSSFGTAGARVATILNALGAKCDQVSISQERLAQLSGLTRVTVAKQLHRLEATGAIALGRSRIVISDTALLQTWARNAEQSAK